MSTCFIYALKCPINLEVRYIGKSVDIKTRFRKHILRAKSGEDSWKNNWIRQLLAKNLKPIIEIIEEVNIENWQEREVYYIDKFRKLGCNLTNSTDGGEGMLNPTKEIRDKLSKALKGGKGFIGNHTQESKLKIKENNRRSKKVLQLNIFGELIAEHNTMSEAAITIVGKPFTAGISKCISGKIKTCYGYKWKLK